MSGEIFGNWMEVDYLAVEENYRSHGYGKQLLQQVEALALKEKCRYVFISTFGFQEKDYYPKFGYQEVLVLENYPLTGTEHFFIKEL
ncbi:GNAT family N-acetyltransferase [Vagococcus fluvialis]|nr:GNAT family N-acetyltransferase [Vagococcus fluvialis]